MAFCTTPSTTTTSCLRDLGVYHLFVCRHLIPLHCILGPLDVLYCTRELLCHGPSAFRRFGACDAQIAGGVDLHLRL